MLSPKKTLNLSYLFYTYGIGRSKSFKVIVNPFLMSNQIVYINKITLPVYVCKHVTNCTAYTYIPWHSNN